MYGIKDSDIKKGFVHMNYFLFNNRKHEEILAQSFVPLNIPSDKKSLERTRICAPLFNHATYDFTHYMNKLS